MRQWLDTHLHLLYPERLHYDWTAELPALQHPFHLHDYLSEARPLGIGPALHMEADVREGDIEDWRKQIRALATLPNVHCKISGVIAYGDPSRWQAGDIAAVAEDLRPYVEQVIQSFGWQRGVWGSDFPVCKLTKGLTTWKQ